MSEFNHYTVREEMLKTLFQGSTYSVPAKYSSLAKSWVFQKFGFNPTVVSSNDESVTFKL
ncbi:hypothetical protein [Peromfec virus RodF8_8]|uniref:Uncharacterized protein n=1 Tax=Peromfec virus RodF8_8 TaxID=2929389 RepID=A0A976N1Y7_9VIRU|nr:hypothetical protein [Peromfec virus RodF8_8]